MKMTKTPSNIGVLILLISFCFLFHVSEAIVDHHPLLQSQKSHDQILMLPGQPGIPSNFEQYSGYVTVDKKAGRALFYYFVEAADPGFKDCAPLLLWLTGGPGCSSLGYGALSEIGPYRVKSDGKTLFENEYSWNKVANVLFLESPVGVGFSYSNTSTDIKRNNDKNTAADSYVFLLNWMKRFPEYKGRDFYIIGESYGGHYAPQLAHTILRKKNKCRKSKIINLKGIGGNALLEEEFRDSGFFEYLWSHAVISDKVIENIRFKCDFSKPYKARSKECNEATQPTLTEAARNYVEILYNRYAPLCHSNITTVIPKHTSLAHSDPCNKVYVNHYLNLAEVQQALHTKFTSWEVCRNASKMYDTRDIAKNTYSLLPNVMANGVPILVYSGDFDSLISFISTKNVLKKLNLTEVFEWSPWKSDDEVAGYRVMYHEGLTFTTIKGAGHMVPSDQAKRALKMISTFLQGKDLV